MQGVKSLSVRSVAGCRKSKQRLATTPDVQLHLSPTVTHGSGEGATEDRAERRTATNGHAAHDGEALLRHK